MVYFRILTAFILLFLFSNPTFGQVPDLTLKLVAETNDKSVLTQVVDVRLLETKNNLIKLYASDLLTPHVLVVELKGKDLIFSDRLGREGRGPGEFIEVTDLQIISDSLLMVYDGSLSRITFFDIKDSEVEKTITLNRRKRIHYPMQVHQFSLKDSLVLGVGEQFFSDDFTYNKKRSELIQAFDNEGNLEKDSILVKQADDAFVFTNKGSMSVNPSPDWGAKSLFRFHNGYIYYSWTTKPVIKKYNKEGELIRSYAIDISELPITDDDKNRILEIESLIMDKRKRLLRKDLYSMIPERWPFIHDFIVDDMGRIWIALPGHMQNQNRNWLVLNTEGKVKGKVRFPMNFKVHQIKGRHIVGELFDFKNFNSRIQLYSINLK